MQVWTQRLKEDADAVVLFDLASGPAIYRVFLFPDALQVDLSFAPAAECALFWMAFGTREEWLKASMVRDLAAIVFANLTSFGIGEAYYFAARAWGWSIRQLHTSGG